VARRRIRRNGNPADERLRRDMRQEPLHCPDHVQQPRRRPVGANEQRRCTHNTRASFYPRGSRPCDGGAGIVWAKTTTSVPLLRLAIGLPGGGGCACDGGEEWLYHGRDRGDLVGVWRPQGARPHLACRARGPQLPVRPADGECPAWAGNDAQAATEHGTKPHEQSMAVTTQTQQNQGRVCDDTYMVRRSWFM
jgi:hypothetical protein